VRARVVQIQALSAHGDYGELIAWLQRAVIAPRRVFVTHGEPGAADAFRRRLGETFGWDATTPDLDARIRLE
jgi:metallo-beta-lactamase family protein